jgi:hypothetical protein
MNDSPLVTTKYGWTRRSILGYGAAALAAVNLRQLDATSPDRPDLRSDATEVKLSEMTVRLARPRVVAERDSGHCWFPDLLRFSTGELMLNYSLSEDSNTNHHNSQAICLSFDGGRNFEFTYDVNGFHNAGGEPRLALTDGRIVGTSMFLKPDPIRQARRFVAHRWTYDRGGRRYQVEPWGTVVEGIPRDVSKRSDPSRTAWSHINWFSDIVPLDDGRWISTISLRFGEDKLESTIAIASNDEGRHWKYLSTVANADSVSDAIEGFDEPCLLQIADGDLMCVSRVGAGADQKLARCYSGDGGKSWSAIDRLPAYSVAPQMVRLASDVLALSTGRPGIFLWLANDPRGTRWQSIDLLQHHNIALPPAEKIDIGQNAAYLHQTTGYTAMARLPNDRLLLVYDRTPFGWMPVPTGSTEQSRIYLLEIEIRRT